MAILKIVVTLLIFIGLLTYLLRNWLEKAWVSNKWNAIILGFVLGAIIGVIVYYTERIWLKLHIEKPFNLMLFYFLPGKYYKNISRKFRHIIAAGKKKRAARLRLSQ